MFTSGGDKKYFDRHICVYCRSGKWFLINSFCSCSSVRSFASDSIYSFIYLWRLLTRIQLFVPKVRGSYLGQAEGFLPWTVGFYFLRASNPLNIFLFLLFSDGEKQDRKNWTSYKYFWFGEGNEGVREKGVSHSEALMNLEWNHDDPFSKNIMMILGQITSSKAFDSSSRIFFEVQLPAVWFSISSISS